MILFFDIGNTAVTYGFYGGGRLHSYGSSKYDAIPLLINKLSKSGARNQVNYMVISSVVPKITAFSLNKVRNISNIKVLIVGRELKPKIRHKYIPLNKLGADRLVDIYGAIRIYKPPFIIIDIGTGITVDYVSSKGVFEGGLILPGPKTALDAMLRCGALLPKAVKLSGKKASLLGNNTKDCLTFGITQGYGSMIDGLVRQIKSRYDSKARVIATGGFATKLRPYLKSIDVFDPMHSIKSLLIIYKDYLRKPKC